MNTKYTPGPWKRDKHNPNIITAQTKAVTGVGREICDVINSHLTDEQDANAQLIAAAPALLEACKAAIPWLEVIPIEYRNRPHYPIAQLRQAIQLAESTDKVTI